MVPFFCVCLTVLGSWATCKGFVIIVVAVVVVYISEGVP